MERVRVVGPEPELLWAGLKVLDSQDVALLCKKNKKEEGPVGASPVAAPTPKSVSL